MSVLGIYAGYEVGSKEKEQIYETMNFLIKSDKDLEATQNLKALEGLREGKVDQIINFMEARVKSSLQSDGIKDVTLSRAKEYQQRYCKNECLGIK